MESIHRVQRGLRIVRRFQDGCVDVSVAIQQDSGWELQVLFLDFTTGRLVLDDQMNLSSEATSQKRILKV